MNLKSLIATGVTTSVLCATPLVLADDHGKDGPKVTVENVNDHVHVIFGRGGNIGLSVGDDGVFMIDDQFANMTKAIDGAIKSLSDKPVEFLINTHYHGDHTGGNEHYGKKGAILVAHDNVRVRLSKEQVWPNRTTPAYPEVARPEVTYDHNMTIYRNGDEIKVMHYSRAHTDGDSVVLFKNANVMHTGDIFFNGFYPFVDVDGGGSIDGLIAAVESMLSKIDQDTRIIPGHGPLTNKQTFTKYLAMLKDVRGRFAKLIAEGKSMDEVMAAQPTKDLDEKWGKGFMKPDRFGRLIYRSLTEK